MKLLKKSTLKEILGELPLTAEMYSYLRQEEKQVQRSESMEPVREVLPDWTAVAAKAAAQAPPGVQVLLFGTLRHWITHTCLTGLALAGLGHRVTLAHLPYNNWRTPVGRFDLRRLNLYMNKVLGAAEPVLQVRSLLDMKTDRGPLPADLAREIQTLAYHDTQYSLAREEIDMQGELYRLRLARNLLAANAAFLWLQENRPDIVIIPNGSILEFGAVYHTARYLDIPVVTYEFGEQNQRIWLAQNAQIMRQETDELWAAQKDKSFSQEQLEQIRSLFEARRGASLWENFSRRWQGAPSEGGQKARTELGLDERPIVLIPTNVLGDSLTLDRQVFSRNMSEWLRRTVDYFKYHPEAQLVIRIHPGEEISWGTSVRDILMAAYPVLPTNIHLLPADSNVNTYDLVEIADLGIVYTTTVGMEMALTGTPVMVVGQTHYRGKGFTLDPDTWDNYFNRLDEVLESPSQFRLAEETIRLAWQYAYCFFFEYPQPFPWHVPRMWKDLETWPLERVLSEEGQAAFGQTFNYLAGQPIAWHQHEAIPRRGKT